MRERRKAMGLSQTDLGRRLGLTFQQVQKYENGLNRISLSRLWMIAGALEIALVDFVRDLPASPGAPAPLAEPDENASLIAAWRRLRSPAHRAAIRDLVERLAEGDR